MQNAFLREIEILTGLDHPNIVRFLDGGTSRDVFFLVMTLCPHGSLTGMTKGSSDHVPPAIVTAILLQCLDDAGVRTSSRHRASGSEAAEHLLARDGNSPVVQVADFGLAKSFVGAGLSGVTATGAIGGTPMFMPREQLTHFKYFQPVSDIWSLAATGYYLLTGKPPLDFPACATGSRCC